MNDFSDALVSLHSFTGCDTVSAFSRKGKVRTLNLMPENESFIHSFKSVSRTFDITDDDSMKLVQRFVWKLYGYDMDDVNKLRYKIYCSKKGNVDCEQLPPCYSSLYQHTLRVDYQSKIWKKYDEANSSLPTPESSGSKLENGTLTINWMTCSSAPEEVSNFYSNFLIFYILATAITTIHKTFFLQWIVFVS